MNHQEDRKRIFIDMDNTLCNYSQCFEKKLKTQPQIAFPQSQYGFFANLDPLLGAIEAYKTLELSYDVYILTAPSYKYPLCYTEKRVWVEKYLGLERTANLIICQRKDFLIGDYLIDDHKYSFQGELIHFNTPQYPDWNTVLEYLL